MKETLIPYVPNLALIFHTFDQAIGRKPNDLIEDNYLSFLLQQHLLVEKDQTFTFSAANEWMLNDGKKRWECFKDYAFRNFSLVNEVLSQIEKESLSVNDFYSSFKSLYAEQDLRTVLSWLESWSLISYQDDEIMLSKDGLEGDDTISSSCIYPLDYHTEVDIKEERYSVFEYIRKLKRGDIILNPDFQRNLVWNVYQKSLFVESAILNIPIPSIYLKRTPDGKLIIVDGLQRSSTLVSFLNNEFALTGLEALSSLNGYTFADLQINEEYKNLVARIEDKQLNCYVLQHTVPMQMVYDIFSRINRGGTKLERQEIRNCVFIGRSTQLLKELADSEIFQKAIGYGISSKRMKDREAVLRCLAFTIQDHKTEYRESMDEFLENAMKKINTVSVVVLDDLKKNFLQIMKWTYEVYGDTNFRIAKGYSKGRINIAVMEVVFYCFFQLLNKNCSWTSQSLVMSYNNLIEDEEFLSAVVQSTGNRGSVLRRFERAHKMFNL